MSVYLSLQTLWMIKQPRSQEALSELLLPSITSGPLWSLIACHSPWAVELAGLPPPVWSSCHFLLIRIPLFFPLPLLSHSGRNEHLLSHWYECVKILILKKTQNQETFSQKVKSPFPGLRGLASAVLIPRAQVFFLPIQLSYFHSTEIIWWKFVNSKQEQNKNMKMQGKVWDLFNNRKFLFLSHFLQNIMENMTVYRRGPRTSFQDCGAKPSQRPVREEVLEHPRITANSSKLSSPQKAKNPLANNHKTLAGGKPQEPGLLVTDFYFTQQSEMEVTPRITPVLRGSSSWGRVPPHSLPQPMPGKASSWMRNRESGCGKSDPFALTCPVKKLSTTFQIPPCICNTLGGQTWKRHWN